MNMNTNMEPDGTGKATNTDRNIPMDTEKKDTKVDLDTIMGMDTGMICLRHHLPLRVLPLRVLPLQVLPLQKIARAHHLLEIVRVLRPVHLLQKIARSPLLPALLIRGNRKLHMNRKNLPSLQRIRYSNLSNLRTTISKLTTNMMSKVSPLKAKQYYLRLLL